MARNRVELEPEQKRAEIVEVARRLFLEAGYEVTSIARIAEEAAVAPNTIYWYFADKDTLLVAVLDALVNDAARELQRRKPGSVDQQLTWLLGEFDRLRTIIATVHARAATSEPLGKWHDGFHRTLEAMLASYLQAHGVSARDLGLASCVTMFVLEGLLAHPSSAKQRRELLQWLVSTIARPEGAPH